MAAIKKIMEKEQALAVLDEIKNNICEVDLDELCGEKTEIVGDNKDEIYKKVIQAVMCGLVYWDEENECMTQKLIHPIKSGEIETDILQYKSNVTLEDAAGFNAKNQAGLLKESISLITGRPIQLIQKLHGQDITIATGCVSFFDR